MTFGLSMRTLSANGPRAAMAPRGDGAVAVTGRAAHDGERMSRAIRAANTKLD